MFCPKCGKSISSNAKFCGSCGNILNANTVTTVENNLSGSSQQYVNTDNSGQAKAWKQQLPGWVVPVSILVVGMLAVGIFVWSKKSDTFSEPPQQEAVSESTSSGSDADESTTQTNGNETVQSEINTSETSQTPVSSPVQNTEEEQIKSAINDHYGNIPGNLAAAHSLFSARMQSRQVFNNWSKGFNKTLSDTVNSVTVLSYSDSEAQAEFRMTSKDDAGNGQVMVREWQGIWNLVKEEGTWKLDAAKITKTAEYLE